MPKFYYKLPVEDSSSQRVNNILTLEERVRAIHAYDERPIYSKVADKFNCSCEQVKDIVLNRKAIMKSYEATQKLNKTDDPIRDEIRKRKLDYLAECMYEYIQRAQFYRHNDLTDYILLAKSLELRDLIEIERFVPNKSWINRIKGTYNTLLSNRLITLTRKPPETLDLKEIMTYCIKNNELVKEPIDTQKTGQVGQGPTTSDSERPLSLAKSVEVVELRRKCKINLMERALYEYLQRASFHEKVPAKYGRIRDVAIQLLYILKIEGLFPNRAWLKHFKSRFNFDLSQGVMVKDHAPPSSLDLRDIISYCSRNDRDQLPETMTLTPEENSEITMRLEASKVAKTKKSILKLAGSVNESAVVETNYQSDDDDVIVVEAKQEDLVNTDDDENDNNSGDVIVINNEDQDADGPPPLKIQKVETLTSALSNDKPSQSFGHWSEHSGVNDMPNIRNYKDALRQLKPLEEFALLKENYRVIGLISQLEDIFKNPPKANDSDNSHEDSDSN